MWQEKANGHGPDVRGWIDSSMGESGRAPVLVIVPDAQTQAGKLLALELVVKVIQNPMHK